VSGRIDTVQRYRHGAILVIGGGGWDGSRRVDRYVPGPSTCSHCARLPAGTLCHEHRPVNERTFVTGPSDFSLRAIMYPRGADLTDETDDERAARRTYDPRCGCCYLGHSHSIAFHDERTRD
jgi:hypothetical protein